MFKEVDVPVERWGEDTGLGLSLDNPRKKLRDKRTGTYI